MIDKTLISICIPTYNRASYLEKTLNSIILQPEFDSSIEIVIADNFSTDGTFELVRILQQNHPNIKYFRNDKNIGMEENFAKVLSLGSGVFLKLINDYLIFKEDSLLYLKNSVLKNIEIKPVLFFSNGKSKIKVDNIQLTNIDEFVHDASYWATWITCFGIWKEDYIEINNKDTLMGLMFFHTALLYQNIINKNQVIIFNCVIFDVLDVKAKGGYSLFDVFINGYLNNLLLRLVVDNRISKSTYIKEKSKFLKGFLFLWYFKIYDNKSPEEFTKKNAFKIIYRAYKYDLCFYFELPYFIKKLILLKLKKAIIYDNKMI